MAKILQKTIKGEQYIDKKALSLTKILVNMSIGKKVMQHRLLKNMSQRRLALMADISQSIVSNIESEQYSECCSS